MSEQVTNDYLYPRNYWPYLLLLSALFATAATTPLLFPLKAPFQVAIVGYITAAIMLVFCLISRQQRLTPLWIRWATVLLSYSLYAFTLYHNGIYPVTAFPLALVITYFFLPHAARLWMVLLLLVISALPLLSADRADINLWIRMIVFSGSSAIFFEFVSRTMARNSALIEKLSNTDSLTELYNRRKLSDLLEIEISRSARYSSRLSVILLDIDHFKSINDTQGHSTGDKVLEEVAEVLRDNIRSTDFAGRWGGEEFLIICPESDAAAAAIVAEKVRTNLQRYKFPAELTVTSSFGVAELAAGESSASLIHRADEALYRAKGNGRNRVEIADS